MPSALVTTPGATTANSYVTLAEFVAWLDNRLHGPPASVDDDKIRALLMGAARIDQAQFEGWRWKEVQSMAWPRYEVYDQDGYYIQANVVPQRVKNAQMIEAEAFLRDTEAVGGRDALAGLSRVKVDVIEVEASTRSNTPTEKTRLLPETLRELRPYMSGSGVTVPLYRS